MFDCRLVAKVDAARGGREFAFFFFFFAGGVGSVWCNLRLRPVQQQGGGLHGERKAAMKLGDSGGSGTVFHFLPPPLKKNAQKFINFKGTIQI